MKKQYSILKAAPFFLKDEQIEKVEKIIADMSVEEKIGQLFCVIARSGNIEDAIVEMTEKYHVGGWMGRCMSRQEICRATNHSQKKAAIPLLISANFEAGGDGLINDGTNVGPNMLIGATGDPLLAAKQGEVCAREGLAVGANYAFAPIVDIGMNFRNPITGTRVYSSDAEFVKEAGVNYVKAVQECGMAAAVKHFPGDGVDERDQHLVTSINSLECEEWDRTYGKVYEAMIQANALTVMVGHIMMPAYSRYFNPKIQDAEILPATLSKEILNQLLREKLGFNGMIITDATTMGGMCIPMSRRKLVPAAIAAGCDMFLFAKNMEEDYRFMMEGYQNGIITDERLEEALIRILGVKMALRLFEKKETGEIYVKEEEAAKVIGCQKHKEIEQQCVDESVTLVKNLEHIIPIDPQKYRRVLIHPLEMEKGYYGGGEDVGNTLKRELEKEGFEVTIYHYDSGLEGKVKPYEETVENFDLILYAANLQTKSNQTTVRIEWKAPMGGDVPSFMQDVPTIFISFANPYHLQDVPRIRTFINAYQFKETTVRAVIDKLLGKSEFKGNSPVDAFCGMWDTRL